LQGDNIDFLSINEKTTVKSICKTEPLTTTTEQETTTTEQPTTTTEQITTTTEQLTTTLQTTTVTTSQPTTTELTTSVTTTPATLSTTTFADTTTSVVTTQQDTTTENPATTSMPATTTFVATSSPIATTTPEATTTTPVDTTTSVAATTTPEETTTTPVTTSIHCCCRCCYDVTSSPLTSSCTVCGDESLVDAAQCAAQPPPPAPTPFTRPTEPNFDPPAQLEGSQFPERLAVTPEFAAMEQLTESLAALPVSEQAALGFTAADFILECTYDGAQCNMDTYV